MRDNSLEDIKNIKIQIFFHRFETFVFVSRSFASGSQKLSQIGKS
ncbi:hypothetical protein LEP1GSC036_0407 [Leptospira weilii str. 2006001853]|uniref:Uncharacterized protein n=2 Tax=Leptospira weilii TaxID=28184 RepID=A0A828Z4Q7_9LEPT|nr:hypothetical protein LEP1GSC036_0407 [Leptospira weilii str. 2006001853]EMM73490.1 hypothetical protein LEP1GSC038_2613 [Leptospira weilii str. 2006001855]EMN44864.1 hypothetical protein LEP1GSC086_0738 [Leptospira weilii str. LNT 1234]